MTQAKNFQQGAVNGKSTIKFPGNSTADWQVANIKGIEFANVTKY